MKFTNKEKKKMLKHKKMVALTMSSLMLLNQGVPTALAVTEHTEATVQTSQMINEQDSPEVFSQTEDETGLWGSAEYSYIYNEELGLGDLYVQGGEIYDEQLPVMGITSLIPASMKFNNAIFDDVLFYTLEKVFAMKPSESGIGSIALPVQYNLIDLSNSDLSMLSPGGFENAFINKELELDQGTRTLILPQHIGWAFEEPVKADGFFAGVTLLEKITLSDDFYFGTESRFEELGGYWKAEDGTVVFAEELPRLYDAREIPMGTYEKVEPQTPEFIGLEATEVAEADEFNPLEGITVHDDFGFDVTDTLTVSPELDTTQVGTHQLIYTAVSSVTGESFSQEREITVSPYGDAKISGVQDISVLQGSEFEPLEGVTAVDGQGNDITKDILLDGKVDTSIVRSYTLKYSVVDKLEREYSADRRVTVTPYGETVFTGVENMQINVGTEFDALEGIKAVDGQGNDITSEITVDGSVDTEVEGTYELTYSVTDKAGQTFTANRTVEVVTPEIDATITHIDEFTMGISTAVTGTYTGEDVSRMALDVNGTMTSSIAVKNETFSYYAKTLIKSSNDTVFVVLLDEEGQEVAREQVEIKDQVNSFTSLNDYTIGTSRQVEGTYEGLATKAKLEIDGVSTGWNGIKDGIFQSYHPDKIKSGREEVYAIITDYNNVELDRQQVNVVTDQLGDITAVEAYSLSKSTAIKGTYSGNISKVTLEINGEELSSVGVKNGEFSYYAKGQIKAMTDEVSVVAYNKFGGVVSRMAVEIVE